MYNTNKNNNRRKDSRSGRTKKAIADSLFHLLESEDFTSITVNDICLEAEVSRATFYLYYEDKYQLLRFCFEQLKINIQKDIDKKGASFIYEVVIEHLSKNIKVFRSLLLGENNKELMNMLHLMFVNDLTEQLEALKLLGIVLPIPIPIHAIFLSAGISNLIVWWISDALHMPQKEFADHLKSLLEKNLTP